MGKQEHELVDTTVFYSLLIFFQMQFEQILFSVHLSETKIFEDYIVIGLQLPPIPYPGAFLSEKSYFPFLGLQ